MSKTNKFKAGDYVIHGGRIVRVLGYNDDKTVMVIIEYDYNVDNKPWLLSNIGFRTFKVLESNLSPVPDLPN